jgi:hypothetical protein
MMILFMQLKGIEYEIINDIHLVKYLKFKYKTFGIWIQ